MTSASTRPIRVHAGTMTKIDVKPASRAKEGGAVGRRAVEEGLPEAHDTGVAPEQVEAQRGQAEEHDTRRQDDPEVVQRER